MCLRAFVLFLGAAMLLGATTVPSYAAWAQTPCGNTRKRWDPQCCYYGYCSRWRQCWVAETGIGVCAPVLYDRALRRWRVNATTRPDLGDVAKGRLITIDNYYETFNGILNPKQLEG
jgi:hypothetical protein